MVLSDLWMTLQKIEAAGHGDYIVNFAGDLCFTERKLAVIEENLFNTRAVGIKMGTKFGDTVSVFCYRPDAGKHVVTHSHLTVLLLRLFH